MQLTKAEEQVMQIVWELGKATVQQVLERYDEPKPARTTVATILSILENKGFATHTQQGKGNLYEPLVRKEDYSKSQLSGIMKNYFDNSYTRVVSTLIKEEHISLEELEELIAKIKNQNK